MNRELIIQKVAAAGMVILAVSFLSPLQMIWCFAFFGQGHFIGAYYYQWKAGKLPARSITAYAAIALVLLLFAYITQWFNLIAFIAGVFFFVHHFQDEVLLFGKERSFFRTLEIVLPVLFLSSLAADFLWLTGISAYAAIFACGTVIMYAALAYRYRHFPDNLSWYLFAISVGLILIALAQLPISFIYLFGSATLFHYACWYVHFYFRFAQNPDRQRRYIIDMIAIHAILSVLLAGWFFVSPLRFLDILFLPLYFYVWAILHIVTSVRMSDYRALLKL